VEVNCFSRSVINACKRFADSVSFVTNTHTIYFMIVICFQSTDDTQPAHLGLF